MTARAGDVLLMPCPFCGGEAAIEEEVPGGFVARCSVCAAQTAIYEDPERARSAWEVVGVGFGEPNVMQVKAGRDMVVIDPKGTVIKRGAVEVWG